MIDVRYISVEEAVANIPEAPLGWHANRIPSTSKLNVGFYQDDKLLSAGGVWQPSVLVNEVSLWFFMVDRKVGLRQCLPLWKIYLKEVSKKYTIFCSLQKGNRVTRSFAERMGFTIDESKQPLYNGKEYHIARYHQSA